MHILLQLLRPSLRSLTTLPAYAAMAVLIPSAVVSRDGSCGHGEDRGAAAVAVPAMVVAARHVELPRTEFSIVTPEYFRASGVRLVRGRMFDAADRADGPPVAIVNEALARRYWPGEDPVGRLITLDVADDDGTVEREVIGVVTNARGAEQLDADVAPAVYLPLAQSPYPFL